MIVTLALWFTLGWFIGLLVYFTWGFMTMPFGVQKRQYAANYYTKIAQKLIGRSGLMERGTKWDLISLSEDSEKNADKFELGDDTAHVTNDTGLLSRWFKQPFGLLAPPDANVASYLSPEVAEAGAVEVERREQDTVTDSEGSYVEEVTLAATRPLVQLRESAAAMIPGNRSYFDLSESEDLYKQSQRGFGEKVNPYNLMIVIIAYAVGAGLTWLVVTQAGGAADAISLPMSLGVGL